MEPFASKRYKARTPEWKVVFDDANALRGVVDAVSAVMNRVTFKMTRQEEGGYVLRFDGADPGMSCVVSARLYVDNVTFYGGENLDEFVFCLECKQITVAMDSPSCAHGSLSIEGYGDKVRVTMQDPDNAAYQDVSWLVTYVDNAEDVKPVDMKLEFCLELDISKVREMIKKARKSHAENMRIQIFLLDGPAAQRSVVIVSVTGETNAYYAQKFCHETQRGEDGSLTVRAAADSETDDSDVTGMDPVFEGLFPVDKIDAFVKILPMRMVVAQVQNSMPLVMTHELGGGGVLGGDRSKSSIRFLIAPINEDDYEDDHEDGSK